MTGCQPIDVMRASPAEQPGNSGSPRLLAEVDSHGLSARCFRQRSWKWFVDNGGPFPSLSEIPVFRPQPRICADRIKRERRSLAAARGF
jgi:hypothetical protein